MTAPFDAVERVADAVLYEGYLLYPYRASAVKNQVRWQFGVVAPRSWSEATGSDPWEQQTEVPLAADERALIDVRFRFLRLRSRVVQAADPAAEGGWRRVAALDVDGVEHLTWDEAVAETRDAPRATVAALEAEPLEVPLVEAGDETIEELRDSGGTLVGRVVRTTLPLDAVGAISVERDATGLRLRVRIENRTVPTTRAAASRESLMAVPRETAVGRALLASHVLLAVHGGAFESLIDPSPEAAATAAACRNTGLWPVLVGADGTRDVVLAAPIILPDHPEVAPESPGDLFDATEIDELLSLRIMTLTDAEKREARATDERAARVIDRTDTFPPEILERLHGAVRTLRASPAGSADTASERGLPGAPWPSDLSPDGPTWEPAARVPPELARIEIDGTSVGRGDRVVLAPGPRGDAIDMFLAGRTATIEAILETVDDDTFVAVSVDDESAELDLPGGPPRYFYFRPHEVRAVVVASDGSGPAA